MIEKLALATFLCIGGFHHEIHKHKKEKNDYEVVWRDDFKGKKLNTNYWGYELGSIRGVEQQHYVDNQDNVYLKDGNLVLEVTKREDTYKNPRGNRQIIYNSGSVRTHGLVEFMYGKIEMRAKLPWGQGVFPAFWTLGADFTLDGRIADEQGDAWPLSGEVDIMELIGSGEKEHDRNKTVYQTLHYSGEKWVDDGLYAGTGTSYTIDEVFADDYHTFTLDWQPGYMAWYVDDVLVREVDYSDDEEAVAALDRPQYIQLNLATGGNWAGDAGDNLEGQKFIIDYVEYSLNDEQEKARDDYYDQTVKFNKLKDITMKQGEVKDLLKQVKLIKGSKNVNLDEFTLDFSIEDEHMFKYKEQALEYTKDDLTDNCTSVDLLCKGINDLESLKNLPKGVYNLHYSAMHDTLPTVRQSVILRIV